MVYTETTSTITSHINNIARVLPQFEPLLENASYETGLPGMGMFYHYYAKFTGESQYYTLSESYLEKGIGYLDANNFRRIYGTDSFDNHVAHVGRYLEFAGKNNMLNWDTEEFLAGIDQLLPDLMKSKIAIGDFDTNSGAITSGLYFLSRSYTSDIARRQLALLVHGIREKALQDADGDYYWTSPSLYNRKYLGISHGSAMLISFLCNVYDQHIERDACLDILRKAVNGIVKRRRTQAKGIFPLQIDDDIEPKQFCMCYGDLGTSYALFRASAILGDPILTKIATEALDDCLLRKKEDNLTLDASIIYGASGLAATFEKIHRLSGDERFREAAAYWYQQIPAYCIHDNGYAGYKTRLVDEKPRWNVSFGWGIIGIGIALMHYADAQLPAIDPLLMIA